jgi:hypothetical protein
MGATFTSRLVVETTIKKGKLKEITEAPQRTRFAHVEFFAF